jgi:hypothetical protein
MKYHTYFKSRKKHDCMVNTIMFHVEGAKKGCTIAKNRDEYDKMELFARRIQEWQHDPGLPKLP